MLVSVLMKVTINRWPLESSFLMDATTSLKEVQDLSSKEKALLFNMDATTN
jgi:hypothetical protein